MRKKLKPTEKIPKTKINKKIKQTHKLVNTKHNISESICLKKQKKHSQKNQ